MERKLVGKIIFTLLLVQIIISFTAVYATTQSVTSVYKVYPDGSASVTVIVSGLTNATSVSVPVESGALGGSIQAYNIEGDPLPVDVLNNGTVIVYTLNTTDTVIVEYEALLGAVSQDMVLIIINPPGKAAVYLPKGAGLLHYDGDPDIDVVDDTITLNYEIGGTYAIRFIFIAPTETTETTGTPITTTTPTETPTTTTTTTTTEAPPPGGIDNLTLIIIAAVIVAAVLVFTALLIKKRKSRPTIEGELVGGLDDRDRAILEALKGGEMSLSELARKVNLSKSVVWRRVRKLVSEGYLTKRDVGGKTFYRLTDKGMKEIGS